MPNKQPMVVLQDNEKKSHIVYKNIARFSSITIPQQLATLNGIRFMLISKKKGEEKKPKEKGWNKDKNYDINSPKLLGHLRGGGNYGIVTGSASVICFDADEFEILHEMGIVQKLPDTFTVRTGRTSSIGKHFWMIVKGLNKKITLHHPTLKDPNHPNERLHLGEIQSIGSFALGPGCIHKSGKRYEIENDAPVAEMDCDELLEIIKPLIIEKHEIEPREIVLRRDENGTHRYDDVDITQIATPRGNVVKYNGKWGTEFKGTHPFHASSGGQNFSLNPSRGIWHCFHHNCGGGWVELLAMKEGIISCGQRLSSADRKKTIRRAYELGILEEEVIEAPTVEIQLDSDEVDEIPNEIPDGYVIELVAPPRTGKTHKVVVWLKKFGEGNYITHTHAVVEHAIKIAREIGMVGAVWVVGMNQPGACRYNGDCENCILRTTKDTFFADNAKAMKLLKDKGILTVEDIPKDMCPYSTLKRAEQYAQYCFTVVNNIGRIVPRKMVILDEEPTLSHFYAGSIEIARIKNTRGDVSNKNYISKSAELQNDLDRIIKHRKKPAFKEYALKMREIEQIIESGSVSGEDIDTISAKIYNAIIDFEPRHIEVRSGDEDGKKDGEELNFNQCVKCLGNIYRENPVRIINRGGGHRSIFILGDERQTCYDMDWMEEAEKIIVIGATRGAIFVKEFEGRRVEVGKFRYDNRFVVIGVEADGILRGNHSEQQKLVIRTAAKLWGGAESEERMPFLVLTGSKREQSNAAAAIKGASRLNKEREGGMKAKYLAGEPAIFYQNSVISRGLDVDQYNLMFVHGCNFAEPFWSVADKGIAAAIVADETTNSVLRISPTLRNDIETMKVVVMPADDMHKVEKYLSNTQLMIIEPEKLALMIKSLNVGGTVKRDGCDRMVKTKTGVHFETGKEKLIELRDTVDDIVDDAETLTWVEKIMSFVREKCRRRGVYVTSRKIMEGISPGNTNDPHIRPAFQYISYHKMLDEQKVKNFRKWGILGRRE